MGYLCVTNYRGLIMTELEIGDVTSLVTSKVTQIYLKAILQNFLHQRPRQSLVHHERAVHAVARH